MDPAFGDFYLKEYGVISVPEFAHRTLIDKDQFIVLALDGVDFILLGGDIFHENKPSRTTLVKTIEILRRYCINDHPVQFQVVSDQTLNFANIFGHVIYEDPYFNVGFPVFTIHGNHDDPAGVVSFDDKKEQLFEMVSIPPWFTIDTRLGSLSIHLETRQCFSAEMYSVDLGIPGKPEDDKVNLAREALQGLLAHWLAKRKHKPASHPSINGEINSMKDISTRSMSNSRIEVDGSSENDQMVYPPFEFSTICPPSVITEGLHGGPWRKKMTDLDGIEDGKDFPLWVLECVLNNRLSPREHTKCSFYLHPAEGSSVQILTQGKLSAPRILRINKLRTPDVLKRDLLHRGKKERQRLQN